ncbi:Hypothetical protein XNRR2_0046 [Streptomyces albidoflavus]|nr:Hypothetical protein XNR_0046 [Streptomyces albidoflavus]ALM36932.1 hypothetical protein SFR_0317 [Streptomyces sp. FR-008]QLP90222.1 Hypothetical protein XNRR2_0046 [Streptomyces albidoflavus]WAE08736.1 Hypothetical protein SAD14_0046 [Streptomyces albidoflavus]WAE14377.1 Hypothetical protein SAD14N_0046 [Streptomyces albidoflavus]
MWLIVPCRRARPPGGGTRRNTLPPRTGLGVPGGPCERTCC